MMKLLRSTIGSFFVRAMPSGELKADPKGPLGIMLASSQSQQLTDMECISYLLPECYALAGLSA